MAFNVNAQCANDSIVYWSESRKLHWNDFQGKIPISYGKDRAGSSLSISPKYNYGDVRVLCYFDIMTSWKRDTSLFLLQHEQLHFDIFELYARKIRKEVSFLTNCKKLNFEKFNNVTDSLFRECGLTNELYDQETSHSLIRVKQIEWEKKIAKDLETLKEYEVDYSDY